jgi:hypothetical protein
MRADDKVTINTALATGAQREFIQVLQEIFLLQGTLKDLIERFLGSQDQVEEQTWNEEEHNEQRRKHLRKDASAPRLDIAECPGNERKPQRNQVGDPDRQEKLCAARRSLNQLDLSLQNPAARSRGP